MDSLLSELGTLALAFFLMACGVAWVWRRWTGIRGAAERSKSGGSDEELYYSDGDPRTKNDHIHAHDPRRLPYGRAYGDNYREPDRLRPLIAVAAIGGILLYFFLRSLPDEDKFWLNQRLGMEPAAFVGAIVVFTLAALVWRYIMKGEELPWASSSPRRRRFANVPRPNPQPKETGEKPRPRRKHKFRRQL